MKIEETFQVDAPVERVWQFITDPNEVGPCVPGCQGIEITSPNTYKTKIKISVGPISASFSLDVEKTEEQPPHFAASISRGEEGGRASTVTAHSILRLSANDAGGTDVYYASEFSVVGRLGKFGMGIMAKKAKSLGMEFAQAFRQRVEAARP